MGAIGLSFGAATSGQGINVANTVSQIVAGYQSVETPWKNQLTALQAGDAAFTSIGSDLATLSTSLTALTNFDGVLAGKQGSSSDPNVLSLISAATNATAGSHTIEVTGLATTSSSYSDVLPNADSGVSGSLSIQVGSGAATNFTLNSTDNTLGTLASAINAASIGVTANVITDAKGSRLSVVSDTSGSAGALAISSSLSNSANGSTVGTYVGQSGADASLTVDGVSIFSASNTVSNAIPGVTFQLLQKSSSPIQVQITNNTGAVGSAFQNLVSAYNAVVKDLQTQQGSDSSGNAEPLRASPTLSLLQQELSGALTAISSGTGVNSFSDLGLSIQKDGTLALNADTLTSQLNSNYAGVTSFFQDANSVGAAFGKVLTGLSSASPTGIVYQALQQNKTQEGNLNADIANEETVIASKKALLTSQLNTANAILQQIPSQLNYVNELYSAITGYGAKQ